MGLFNKRNKEQEVKTYSFGLNKSRKSLKEKIQSLINRFVKVDEEYFASLEEILISADVGASLSMKIIDHLKEEAKTQKLTNPSDINNLLFNLLKNAYTQNEEYVNFCENSNGPTVILVMGVNGVGKTTSIAKLAYKFKNKGKKVLLVAGDTFRAGAVEQLQVWADRLDLKLHVGKENSDPSGVIYDGVKNALDNNYDVVICDTAGRLQTKENLMNEASKMIRVIKKVIPSAPHECLLVLDATTGQNGVYQAKAFNDIAEISGIILTKMDGTSKGGIILAIKDQLNIPVKFVGLGEKIEDLEIFDIDLYLRGLIEENGSV